MSNSSLSYPAHVAFASYTALSLPSPRGRRYRLKVLWSDLTPRGPSGGLRYKLVHLTLSEGNHGASQVPGISLPACHALRPRQSLQDLTITIPSCRLPEHQHRRRLLLEVTRLNCFGECGLSCGPQDSLCTLRISCPVVSLTPSSIPATLDTGGWLGLTRQGLPPCKKCQAWPGALMISLPFI